MPTCTLQHFGGALADFCVGIAVRGLLQEGRRGGAETAQKGLRAVVGLVAGQRLDDRVHEIPVALERGVLANRVLCGGDALFFENQLKGSIFAVPELVLSGLNSILIYNVSR